MKKKNGMSLKTLYRIFVYVVLLALAVSIFVPVAWVFLASIKENSEFYGSPWTMPKGFYIQNFIDAFEKANMGQYFLNSILVTAMALCCWSLLYRHLTYLQDIALSEARF